MKQSLFCVLCCIFLLTGCINPTQPIAPIDTTASVSTQTEPAKEETAWFQKMKLDYGAVWSMPVIETSNGLYYLAEDGIYQYQNNTGTDTKIISEVAYGLFLHANQLFFNTGHEIKKADLDGENVSVLWSEASLSDFPELSRRYVSICDFQILDGFLYIAITGTCAIRVCMENGMTEMFLDDFSQMIIRGQDCFYIDHAQKTFSLYQMHCATKEIMLLRGEGYSEPEPWSIRIDSIGTAGSEIFYCVRDTAELFQYCPTGEDMRVFSQDSEGKTRIRFVERCPSDTLLYYAWDSTSLKLYEHTPSGDEHLILSSAFAEGAFHIAVTDSAIFYITAADSVVHYIER